VPFIGDGRESFLSRVIEMRGQGRAFSSASSFVDWWMVAEGEKLFEKNAV
jgi:hypothetical protein